MWVLTRRFVLSVLLLVGAFAAPAGAAAPGSGEGGAPFLDVRDGVRAEAVAERRNAPDAPAGQERAADGLVAGQGPQATLELDPTTGTVRSLADLSGALTGPSGGDPRDIALSYVRAHRVALGLTEADLATLRPAGEDVSPEGLVVVRWRQQTGGISVFDNGLVVTLDHAGRVLSVGGAPLHEPDPNASAPDLSADQALAQLRDSVGDSSGTETAAPQRTYFDVNGALRLAWHLQYRASSTALYDAVVDATSGRVLYRANLVRFAVNVNVFPHYPGAQFGGTQQSVDLSSYLSTTGSLSGPNAVAYADLNDDDSNNGGAESVNPSTATSTFNATYSLQSHGHCASSAPCSWDHTVASSWQTNKAQDAIQAFWFVNVYHDHLAAAPIGFTTASGAFEDDDRLVVNTDDGANGTGGVPSSGHRNNANMSTPPDGSSPQMQMYLFGNSSSFRDVNGGDTAEIVFHEYTHGLTSRLVHDASGAEALDSAQSGAMGEAWSDWYAMDFLNRGDAPPSGLGAVMVPDTPTPGEVDMGAYTDAVPNSIRSQPLDCPVGASATLCPGGGTAGSGGYTYGDFGKICGCGPEVHADGEIWSETLWDLRSALIDHFGSTTQGSDAAEQLVTGALRLSPPEPTFLDMRNAILLADNNLGAPYRSIIWDVFAHRGMGFFAGVTDGSDINPAEDFNGPPAAGGPTGTLAGTVKDAITGKPIAGVTVSIGGHSSGVSVFTATTGSDGHYSMSGVPAGTYGKVFVTAGSGYDASVRRNVAVSGATTLDFPLHHNWAASDSGGAIASTNDNYYGEAPNDYGCGTAAIIDGLQGNGWSAWRPATDNDYPSTLSGNPPTATIALPRTIDISGFAGDPSATCGDDITATTKTFTIETSPDDATWTMAYDGRSASTDFDVSDAGTMKALAPTGGTSRVRYVRVTLLSPQSISSSDDGFEFIDFSEFAVYGNPVPTAALSVPSAATAGDTVALDASGSSDDSAIASYGWDFDGNGSVDATTGGPVVNHVYDQPGTFAPRVTVTDDGGSTAVASGSIAVSAGQTSSSGQTTPPSGETTPPPGQTTPAPEQTTPQPAAPGLPRLALLAGARITGVSLRLACAVSCGGTATLTVSAKVARRLGLRFRTISRVTIKALQGTRTLRIAVKRSVLALLRAHRVRSLRPTLHGAVTDRLGRHARLTGTPLVRITPR